MYTMIAFLTNVLIYKIIFNNTVEKTIILTCFVMIITMVADIICCLLVLPFFDVEVLRSSWLFRIGLNIIICLISIAVYEILKKIGIIRKIDNNIFQKQEKSVATFITLTLVIFISITYNLYINFKQDDIYISNLIIVTIFLIISYIFLKDKNKFVKLSADYDNLFNYIQNFEDWIEKEQLNRHEYKNQLAVLRDITKEKKTKNKIDEILEDNINIEGGVVNQLKTLPKGGLKGLMYYKLVIAQKNKINLTVDVSIKKTTVLNKLSEKQMRDLCKLIGIYFDNAIEAARETKKRSLLIEIYELKDRVNIVFSNTFKKTKDFNKRYEKGVSSKGKERGNGLYFAKKILSKNNWVEDKQEVIDKYYIQKISILKLEK